MRGTVSSCKYKVALWFLTKNMYISITLCESVLSARRALSHKNGQFNIWNYHVWEVLVIRKLCCTHNKDRGYGRGEGQGRNWGSICFWNLPLWPALEPLCPLPSLVPCVYRTFSPEPPVLNFLPGSGVCFSNTFSSSFLSKQNLFIITYHIAFD